MAYQPAPHGLSADIKKKLQEKRDPGQEEEVLQWIEKIIGTPLDRSIGYVNLLHGGDLLCRMFNCIVPGSIKKVNDKPIMPFKIMENINGFLEAITRYGVPVLDLFQTIDLFEKKDICQVTQTLYALGRTCQSHNEFNRPILGPKLSSKITDL